MTLQETLNIALWFMVGYVLGEIWRRRSQLVAS